MSAKGAALGDGGGPASDTRGAALGLPRLTILVQAFCLLAAEGASVALAGWALRVGDALRPYVTANVLDPAHRPFVAGNLLGGALAGLAIGSSFLLWKKSPERLWRLSRRLSPLTIAWLAALLLEWELWKDRDLPFLVLAAAFGIGVQRTVRVACLTEPVFEGLRAPRWLSRAGAWLAGPSWVRHVPLALTGVAVVVYGAFFSYHTTLNHYRIGTAALDLGLENNLVWNAMHWGPLFKSSPLGGPISSHGGYHQTWFAYVLALPYRLAPGPQILLVIQSIFMGAAALPLYFLAARKLSRWMACLLSWLFVLYAPLHGANLYDFHYLPLATFFLWTTLNLVEARRYVWTAIAVLFALSLREDVSALLVILGAYLVLGGERPKAGLVLGGVGAVYFVLVKIVLMPRFLGGTESFIHQYSGLLPQGDRGYGGVIKTVIANPAFTITTLLERAKLVYLLQIIVPLAFLPWRRPIGLLCSVPGFLFTLLATNYPPLIQASFQYTAYWTTFLFIALIANLAWLRKTEAAASGRVAREWRASRIAWVLALVCSMLVTSHQFGALLQQNTARGGFGPYRFDIKPADHDRHARLYRLIAQVPPKAKIVSSELIVPHVSNRPDSYTLRTGMFDAEYLLVWTPIRSDERSSTVEALRSGRFGVVDFDKEFLLAKKGHPTDKNQEAMRRHHLW